MYDIDLTEAEISGSSSSGHPKTLTVSIEKCDPKNLEIPCVSESEMTKFWRSTFVGIMSIETYLDFNDIDNPIKQKITSLTSSDVGASSIYVELSLNSYDLIDS